MGMLTIRDSRLAGVTLIPDDFVDYYMPRSSGEFVKIYLYLLRCVHKDGPDPTLSTLADVFSCTEKDIQRALNYWQRAGLLKLSYTGSGKNRTLAGIELLPVNKSLHVTQSDPDVETADGEAEEDKQQEETAQISTSRVRALKDDEDARQILFVTEKYIGRPLTSTDMRRILYFYDVLHFPPDLIDYLVEYCVERGHRNFNYIEKVGLAWNDAGIRTMQEAKDQNNQYLSSYFKIFSCFGIRNRNPIPSEIQQMDKWLNEYGSTMEMIAEAAQRTITKTSQPSFPYADRILSDWKNAGCHSLEEVRKYEAEHAPATTPRRSSTDSSRTNSKKPAGTGFNSNFHQRDYDYDKLEQALTDHRNS